jgi:polysaccharide deacetylase 2 family uncharacterized protein YibQ
VTGALLFLAGFAVALLWQRRPTPVSSLPAPRSEAAPRPPRSRPAPPRAARREEGVVLAPDPEPAARLAIVIDDLGNDVDVVRRVAAMSSPVTAAVLPALARSRESADILRAGGKEILLHLPMEPLDPGANPGPGEVRVGMTASEIASLVASDIADVPGAAGVNNHMGSRASADRATMNAVFSVLRQRRLFFLDSRTTAFTVAVEEAARRGVPCVSRSVFLDDAPDEASVVAQLDRAVEEARAQGAAIAIGHPHAATLAVLERELPDIAGRGLVLCRVSDLVAAARP